MSVIGWFTRRLVVTARPDGKHWELAHTFGYTSRGGRSFQVPRGFVTDFASVPRALWSLIPPWGKHGQAAVLHDYLYQEQPTSRGKADKLLLEACKVLGVAGWRRWAIYAGVRAGGWLAWKAHKRLKVEGESK